MVADIAIVGAGFTGAFAAAALADGRKRIVVLDSSPARRPQFGGELIHAAGVDKRHSSRAQRIAAVTTLRAHLRRRAGTDPGIRPSSTRRAILHRRADRQQA